MCRRDPPVDEHLAHTGRVMEILSEHTCQGWLEGYLLTGRHGLFSCYEAFIHLVDSMLNQHAKWLKTTRDAGVAAADRLAQLPAHLARVAPGPQRLLPPGPGLHRPRGQQEGRGGPGLPAAGHQHPALDHASTAWSSQHYVNVVVAGKQPQFDWLDAEEADLHCARGLGIWDWASTRASDPDVVIACAGDVPTLEALAAVAILREQLPELKVRFVNVVDLMRLQDETEHPHGLSDRDFDTVFTADKPVIFAYHGYPWLIHRLTYRRTNHDNLHVRGYKEEGTTTTPFDMVMMNDLDRYHLVMDVIDRVPGARVARGAAAPGDGRHPPPRPAVDPRARRGPARGARLVLERAVLAAARPLAVDHRRAATARTCADAERSVPVRLQAHQIDTALQQGRVRDRLPGDGELLVGRDDEHLDGAVVGADAARPVGVGLVALGVDLDAQARQPGERVRAQPGHVLADAGGEDHGVGTAEHGEVGADVLAQPVAVDVVRRARARSSPRRRPQQVAEVVHAGQPLQPRAVVQQVLERRRGRGRVAQQVQQDAGVEVAGPGAHHQPLQRGQAHRGVDRAPAPDRRRRGAVAEVQHDQAQPVRGPARGTGRPRRRRTRG